MIFAKLNSKIIVVLIIFGFTACSGCSKVGTEDNDLQILNKIQDFMIKTDFAQTTIGKCAVQMDYLLQHLPKYDETDPRNYRMKHYYNASRNVTSIDIARKSDASNLERNFVKFYVEKKDQEKLSGKDITWNRENFIKDYKQKSETEVLQQAISFFNAPKDKTFFDLNHATYLSEDERNEKCDALAQRIDKGDFYLSNANDSDLSEAIARVGIQ